MRCTIGLGLLALAGGCFDDGDDLETTAQDLVGTQGIVRNSPYNGASRKLIDVVCPSGTVGLSVVYGADNGSDTLTDMAFGAEVLDGGTRWRVRAADFSGAPSWKLSAGVTCAVPPEGYELVTGTSPGGAGLHRVELGCSAGKVVVGAAFGPVDTSRIPAVAQVLMSMPAADGTSWVAHARSVTADGPFRGTLICADPWDLPGHEIVHATGLPGTSPLRKNVATCPDHGFAVSGGWAALDEYDVSVDGVAYFDSRALFGWQTWIRIDAGWVDPWKLQTAAVCIDAIY